MKIRHLKIVTTSNLDMKIVMNEIASVFPDPFSTTKVPSKSVEISLFDLPGKTTVQKMRFLILNWKSREELTQKHATWTRLEGGKPYRSQHFVQYFDEELKPCLKQ